MCTLGCAKSEYTLLLHPHLYLKFISPLKQGKRSGLPFSFQRFFCHFFCFQDACPPAGCYGEYRQDLREVYKKREGCCTKLQRFLTSDVHLVLSTSVRIRRNIPPDTEHLSRTCVHPDAQEAIVLLRSIASLSIN